MSIDTQQIIEALRRDTPDLLRWSGAIAKNLRRYNVALDGKTSGSVFTDALTLADLTVQELLLAGLRDRSPELRQCRIEAEEANGDFTLFAKEGPLTIAIDPIDGTRQFRDHTGDGYAVMLHLRSRDEVLYSLVFAPESGATGTWVQAYGEPADQTSREGAKRGQAFIVKCGADDTSLSAFECLERLPAIRAKDRPDSSRIYLIGFQSRDPECAQMVTAAGLQGVPPDDMPGSVYQLLASGEFGGSLIHTPNIYDYPVSMQLVRAFGGDSVWVHNGEPVHFEETWMDDRADMLRLPGIVATADSPKKLQILVDLARDWSRERYATS